MPNIYAYKLLNWTTEQQHSIIDFSKYKVQQLLIDSSLMLSRNFIDTSFYHLYIQSLKVLYIQIRFWVRSNCSLPKPKPNSNLIVLVFLCGFKSVQLGNGLGLGNTKLGFSLLRSKFTKSMKNLVGFVRGLRKPGSGPNPDCIYLSFLFFFITRLLV